MAIRLPTLEQKALDVLNTISTSVPFILANNRHRHIGANRGNNVSQYEFSRWYEWKRNQRNDYKTAFNPKQVERSVVGWFLKLKPNVDFLDKMTQWEGQSGFGTIVSYALQDNQAILINNRQFILNKGEGITFNVNEVHEIKPSTEGQLWACLMLPDPNIP